MSRTLGRRRRPGFTLMECVIALAVLAVALTAAAEVAVWSLRERGRNVLRQEALEAAANVLESSRACPWDDLTPQWAAAQRLPEAAAGQLPGARLTVQVEPEPSRPRSRRVTVEIQLEPDSGPMPPVRLVGLFSARSAADKGGTP